MLELLLSIRLVLKSFFVANTTSMSSACVSSRKSFSNAINDEIYDSNDAINENISDYHSNDNDIITRLFKFLHDSSLVNEWNNSLDVPMLQEQQK